MNYKTQKRFIVHVVFLALILGLLYLTSKFLIGYLMPLLIGIIVSILIQRPLGFLCRKTPLPRTFWSLTLVISSFAALISLAVLLGYQLYDRLSTLAARLPEYIPTLMQFLNRINDRLAPIAEKIPSEIVTAVQAMPEALLEDLTERLTSLLSGFATDLFSAAPAMLVTFFVTIVASCYITKDFDALKAFVKRQIPEKYLPLCRSVKFHFSTNILKMLRGYLLIMGITFAELAVGLLILGVDWAIPLAALIAVVDVLPVLGVGTVLIPWAVVEVIAGRYFLATGLVLVYLTITIVRSVIEPKIIAGQVGLNPLVTLLAMYCGLKIFGLIGLVGFPIALILLTALQREGRIRLWKTAGEENQAKPVE